MNGLPTVHEEVAILFDVATDSLMSINPRCGSLRRAICLTLFAERRSHIDFLKLFIRIGDIAQAILDDAPPAAGATERRLPMQQCEECKFWIYPEAKGDGTIYGLCSCKEVCENLSAGRLMLPYQGCIYGKPRAPKPLMADLAETLEATMELWSRADDADLPPNACRGFAALARYEKEKTDAEV